MGKVLTVQVSGSPKGNPRTREFAFLWAKHVQGFNPANHCAACLVGPWERKIKVGMVDGIHLIPMKAEFFYICGVAPNAAPHRSPERAASLARNFHLVLRYKEGGEVIADTYNGVRFNVLDAERITINPLPHGWNGLTVHYTTCRNFQFGVQQFGYDLKGPQGGLF